MKSFRWIVTFVFALTVQVRAAEPLSDWLLPNLGARLTIQVSNPSPEPVKMLATIPTADARKVALEFPGRLAFALLLNPTSKDRPATFLPLQIDDLDGDGTPDQFEFPVELAAHERRQVDIYYSTTLDDTVSYPKRVHAKHSYGYNREVVALESELVGYRTYGGFFLDIMGRSPGLSGLNNDLAGYVPVFRDLGAGRDVFHIGGTLGLGGLFLRRNGKVWQPPMNVPSYAHKPSPPIVPHYKVISQGPLRAIVEATLDDWAPDGDRFRIRAVYSIDAGTSNVRCHVEIVPLEMAGSGGSYEVGIGVRELPAGTVTNTPGQFIVTGRQNQRDGDIGLGLFYEAAAFDPVSSVRTQEGTNHGLVSRSRLTPGRVVTMDYSVAGAWSGSGISNLSSFLGTAGKASSTRLDIGEFRFQTTPRPDKVDAEAQ